MPATRPGRVAWPLLATVALTGAVVGLCAVACALLLAPGTSVSSVAESLSWREALDQATRWQVQHPWAFGLGFFVLFTVMAAVPLPGCSLLALAAGAWWGWIGGALVVTLASTVGATLAFLAARHAGRDAVQRRWGHRLERLETVLERHGGVLVFWLRLAPLIPYPVLNPLLGLTRLSTLRFFVASAAGMLASSALYTWLGAEMGHALDWRDLLAPPVLAAVAALMALPLVMRHALWRLAPGLRPALAAPAPRGR